ncbi:AraC family transcriptional regulator [Embleya sp. NPDC050493]|uniref:AraC family transcriptional regulator n=2 Tax=unclassified Embleya TaxID=2699296 RepID=UPI00378AEA7E
MDYLARITASLRTQPPRWERIEAPAAWARAVRPGTETAFHVVLRGNVTLTSATGARLEPGAGDVVLVTGDHHLVSGLVTETAGQLPAVPAMESRNVSPARTPVARSDEPPGNLTQSNRDPVSVLLLSGTFRLDAPGGLSPTMDLPETIHLADGPNQDASVRALVDLLRQEETEPAPGNASPGAMATHAVTDALLDALLVCLLRWWHRRHGARPTWDMSVPDPAIGRVLCAMHHNPEQPWTVERLGAVADLPRSTFARRFTESVGRPPLSHLTLVRMNAAATLLRDTDAPLSAVAQHVGYASEFAFSTAFKREFGIAPTTYRQKQPTTRVA